MFDFSGAKFFALIVRFYNGGVKLALKALRIPVIRSLVLLIRTAGVPVTVPEQRLVSRLLRRSPAHLVAEAVPEGAAVKHRFTR